MQLMYRGIAYQTSVSVIETTASAILGRYRGVPYAVSQQPYTQSALGPNLRYRGCWYAPIAKQPSGAPAIAH